MKEVSVVVIISQSIQYIPTLPHTDNKPAA